MKENNSALAGTEYSPGECNIGSAEIVYRRRFGWVLSGVTLAGLLVLLWSGVDPLWRLLLSIPAGLSAVGFLQARSHFCVRLAHEGIYNFGPLGERTRVQDADARRRDRRKAGRIVASAAIIGLLFAAAGTFLV